MKNSIYLLTAALLTGMLFSAQIAVSQVFITELADPDDNASCRYVELYNAGSEDVDLNEGWALQRFTNDNVEPQSPVSLTGIIPAGGFYIIANDGASFTSCYGITADQDVGTGGAGDSNGDDIIQLVDPSETVVDIFGNVGTDGSGTCHEFEDGRAERVASVTSGNAGSWNEANWNVWADSSVGGCTSHTGTSVSTTDGLFDPGSWIGAAPSTSTEVAFAEFDYSISEDGGSIDVCVSIVNADDNNATTVEVDLDGSSSAVNGVDYDNGTDSPISFPLTLTFPAGDSNDQCLSISIVDDAETETEETVVLNLQNASGGDNAGVSLPAQTTVTITDNDQLPTPDVVISEIMYNTSGTDDEWIEICNVSGATQSVGEYTVNVGGGVEFTFDPGVEILDGECITVSLGSNGDGTYNPDCPFTPTYGIDANTDDSNNLVNSSTTIALVAPDGLSVADEVTYDDANGADGNGSSLHVVDAGLDNSSTGSNWQEVADGGTAGNLGLMSSCTVTETIVQFSDATYTESEGGGVVTICVLLENPDAENATTVDVVLEGTSTASNGDDYDDGAGQPIAFPQSLTFPAGDNVAQCISFSLIDDEDVEDNETVILTLQNLAGGNTAMLGANNQAELTIVDNDTEVNADIVINEIHYNPCGDQGNDGDFEFLELYNNGDTEVDLTGWMLSNAVDYTFSEATIAAGEYIIVAVNAASYEGNGYQVFQFFGGLTNSGETITLLDFTAGVADEVAYSDNAPWPTSPDGSCPSLELIDTNADNNDAANWQASFVPNGTPGAANSTAPDATAYTIVELQSETHTGEFVITSGVVTGVFGSQFTMQDGSGANSGIWVNGSGAAVGDLVEVEGAVSEENDLTQINANSVAVNSSGNALPAAEILTTVNVSEEQWEGVLVQTSGDVASEDLSFGEWSIDDGSGAVVIDDLAYNAQPVVAGDSYQITAPLYFSFGQFKLTPRDEADVAKLGCTNESADNYDPEADIDDGSCNIVGDVLGCTYAQASNYNPNATDDDGSCEFPEIDDCPTDLDNDGITATNDLLFLLGNFGATCPQ